VDAAVGRRTWEAFLADRVTEQPSRQPRRSSVHPCARLL